MLEVTKMYKNAGVEPICDGIDCGTCMAKCNNGRYPEFAAEKQLELIKWMIKTNHRYFIQDIMADDFSENLARVFNLYWQDLIPEEKQQIREVLNG